MSPDRSDYGGNLTERERRKFREYQIQQDGIAWNAFRRLGLETESQVAIVLACCDDYGSARWWDLQNQSARMGAIEKEQRRQAKQFARTLRKLASQVNAVRHGGQSGAATEGGTRAELSAAQVAQRILSRKLRRAFWSEEGSLVSGLEPDLLKLAESIDRCLEDRPGTKDLNTQAKALGRRRENALLGPQTGGDGMVSLASNRNGKVDYSALVKIVLVLHPCLAPLSEGEIATEVERRSGERSSRTSRENNIPG